MAFMDVLVYPITLFLYICDSKVMVMLSQPHFEGSVRSPLRLPKMGLESPPGLLKTQSLIAGSKHLALMCSLYRWKGFEV
jgi:hypothetical protein